MKQTLDILNRAFSKYRVGLAYSGGGDSTVMLDIAVKLGHHPPVIYVDSQMEYCNTLDFAREVAEKYQCDFHVAKAPLTPVQQWDKTGFPMLGKMAARIWMQKHKKEDTGYKLDVSTCCRKMKIEPGRKMLKQLQLNGHLTGQRGAQDDRLRGLRAIKDGAIKYLKQDKITQINPLLGWTDLMIRRYTAEHSLPIHPQRKEGALTIGCMYCGGGAQFDNSGFRVLRLTKPDEWHKMIVDFKFGPIILAIKYDQPLPVVTEAIAAIGGLEHVADTMPHVFDFLRKNPLKGYNR